MSRQKNRPTKLLASGTGLSPSSRDGHCCLCDDYLPDGFDRRNLWQTADRKSRLCYLVERVLQVSIVKSVHSEVICPSCLAKVKKLDAKVKNAREEVDEFVRRIGRCGAGTKCIKRDIRERITAIKPSQCGNRRTSDGSFGDDASQSALVSAVWMSSLLPDAPTQFGCSALTEDGPANTPAEDGTERSPSSADRGESTSRTTHVSEGDIDHEVWDTTTGERVEHDAGLHGLANEYARVEALRDDDGLNEVAKDDWDDFDAVKSENCNRWYDDLDVSNSDTIKSEESDSRYIADDKDYISRYIDEQLSKDAAADATTPKLPIRLKKAAATHKPPTVRRKKPKRMWKCDSCTTLCYSRSAFVIHTRIHTGVKPYTCDMCGHSFAQTSCLKTHLRTHTGEKPHVCMRCGKHYATASELRIHERAHRGERPYLCSTCGKAFVSSSNLRQHEATHIVARRHACPTCDKTFVTYSHLTRHQKIHSGLRPHVCYVCGKSFSRGHHLTRHERALHPSNVV